ncbi:GEVED domain-containing protein [Aliikangiella coralliicola]|uniref:GEVED domain-containing protein n=1 Tax=Aliikangiella coralliicola TaxID=2592383 RepID=A0A545UGN7_9GAMM|nr:GEVED domain-containing protein [Aliikangiella coralliicola]TQV88636.1 hypothetical protein FLL46_08970 [Aliikangiella coralliicola]
MLKNKSKLSSLFLLPALFCSTLIKAETLSLNQSVSAYGIDGGANYNWTMDGEFDNYLENDKVVIRRYRSLDFTKYTEFRGMFEFNLGSIPDSTNISVDSAKLKIKTISSTSTFGDKVRVYGYTANGTIELDDFEHSDLLVTSIDYPTGEYEIDVTSFVADKMGTTNYIGFNLVASWWDAFLSIERDAQLEIEYSSDTGSVNELPVVNISSPTGQTFYEGVPIHFSATASDVEDGDLSAQISWHSPYYGDLGTGASFSKTFFANSNHVVRASVTDSLGGSTSESISFSVLANSTPTVNISTPAQSSTYHLGENIQFNASAQDEEDGNIDPSISWSSDVDGHFGTGAQISITSLSLGEHVITAAATDSVGAINTATVQLSVTEVPDAKPVVNILSPANNAEFLTSDLIEFTAEASDQEDGEISDNIEWTYNGSGPMGNGKTVSRKFEAGTYTINARIGDSAGQRTTHTILINVKEDTSVVSYCAANGRNTSYEWIQEVQLADKVFSSGKSTSGYQDLTEQSVVDLRAGSNTLILKPGFRSTSYRENWKVWIDFNKNGEFETDESVFSQSSKSQINGEINLPMSVETGVTRARIAMRYGSYASPCGSFPWGEVEDFTVNIQ